MKVLKKHIGVLNRFTALVAFLLDADFNSLRGITDEKNKLYCAYLAHSILEFDVGVVSAYYRINTELMKTSFDGVKVDVEVYNKVAVKFGQIRNLWDLIISNE